MVWTANAVCSLHYADVLCPSSEAAEEEDDVLADALQHLCVVT